jgi:hypothetical protein
MPACLAIRANSSVWRCISESISAALLPTGTMPTCSSLVGDVLVLHCVADFRLQAGDNDRRQAGRSHEAEPRRHGDEVRHRFLHCRKIRPLFDALVVEHAEQLDLAAWQRGECRRIGREIDLHAVGQQIADDVGVVSAGVGHVQHIDAGGDIERLALEVEHRAAADAAIVEFALVRLGVGDKPLRGVDAERDIRHEIERSANREADRGEVLERVEAHGLAHQRAGDHGA